LNNRKPFADVSGYS